MTTPTDRLIDKARAVGHQVHEAELGDGEYTVWIGHQSARKPAVMLHVQVGSRGRRLEQAYRTDLAPSIIGTLMSLRDVERTMGLD